MSDSARSYDGSRTLTPKPRVLFVISEFPRPRISIADMLRGEEPLSGTDGSLLLVAEGLARRGYEVGLTAMNGSKIEHGSVLTIPDLEKAAGWSRPEGRVVWVCGGENELLARLNAIGVQPFVWLQLDYMGRACTWLKARRIKGIVSVSDTMSAGSFRVMTSRRIVRRYNPLNPFFATREEVGAAKFASQQVIFSGYIGGAARVLQMWPYVRRALPGAKLIVAGSEQLYGDWRDVGAMGIAEASFEQEMCAPLTLEFGSLEKAGVFFAGLVRPSRLLALYGQCALGLVNFTWDQNQGTETFCCAAVEMLASRVPVFSVARGALPETIGRSGGAVLTRHQDVAGASQELVHLLGDAPRLAQLAQRGLQYVRTEYAWDTIVSQWEDVVHASGESFYRLNRDWRGPRTLRSTLGRSARLLGVESLLS